MSARGKRGHIRTASGLITALAVVVFLSSGCQSSLSLSSKSETKFPFQDKVKTTAAPKKDVKASKVEETISFSTVNIASIPDAACRNCHSNMQLADKTAKTPFSHAKHLALKGHIGGCESCHLAEPHNRKFTGMKSGVCVQCHKMDYPHGERAKWLPKHGYAYIDNKKPCELCHIDYKTYCIGCHGVLMPHPDTFKKDHPKSDKKTCGQCHKGKDFCTVCHHKKYSRNFKSWLGVHNTVVLQGGSVTCFQCHTPTYCSYCHVRGKARSKI